MRKIEKEVIGAFVKGDTKMLGNTMSTRDSHTGDLNLLLHGNRIATMSNRDGVKKLWVSNAGWSSRTTQSRLNALFSLLNMPERVYIKGGTQYLDSSRHNTINLSALRKSAVLVYEREVEHYKGGAGKSSLPDKPAPSYFDATDEWVEQPKPVRDAAYQLFLNRKPL
jgi:hypothetical protein